MSSIPKPHTNLTNFTNRLSSMIQRFDVGTRLSEMAIHNGVVYLAGQIPEDPHLGIEGQTQQVLDDIDKLLARAGSDKSKLLTP